MVLKAILLGQTLFSFQDIPLSCGSRKATALLAYLSLQNQPVRREQLAELLWGSGKLNNLRQALYELRKLPGSHIWLKDDDETIAVKAISDVAAFESAIRAKDAKTALELYQGRLLADLQGLGDGFDNWLELEHERLQVLYLEALQQEAAVLEQAGSFAEALAHSLRVLQLDNLNESAYQAAMRLSYLLGDRRAALTYYRKAQEVLREELDSAPLPETQALADTIQQNQTLKPKVFLQALPEPLRALLSALVLAKTNRADLLASMLNQDALSIANHLGDLQNRGLLDDNQQLRADFYSEIIKAIPKPLLQHLSRQAAQWYSQEQPDTHETTARHWLLAQEPELAAAAFLQAAQQAFQQANSEAGSLCFYTLWSSKQAAIRFDALILLEALSERQGNPALQDACITELVGIAWNLQDDGKLAEVRLRQSRFDARGGRIDKAIEQAQEALDIAKRLNDKHLLQQAHNTLGGAYYYAGRLQDAFAAFAQLREATDLSLRFRALNNMGAIAGMRKEFVLSYEQFSQALTLARELGSLDAISATLSNLASTAERLADYARAEKHYHESLSLIKRTQDQRLEITTLANLAFTHSRRGHLGFAWNTAQEALELATSLSSARELGIVSDQLADVARRCSDYQTALEWSGQSLEHFRMAQDVRRLLYSETNTALLQHALGQENSSSTLASLEKLRTENYHDIAAWAFLELALITSDNPTITYCLSLTKAEKGNAHLEFVRELAQLRQHYLKKEPYQPSEDFMQQVMTSEFSESPLACFYLAHFLLEKRFTVRMNELLELQSQGLPRQLKDILLAQPQVWQNS